MTASSPRDETDVRARFNPIAPLSRGLSGRPFFRTLWSSRSCSLFSPSPRRLTPKGRSTWCAGRFPRSPVPEVHTAIGVASCRTPAGCCSSAVTGSAIGARIPGGLLILGPSASCCRRPRPLGGPPFVIGRARRDQLLTALIITMPIFVIGLPPEVAVTRPRAVTSGARRGRYDPPTVEAKPRPTRTPVLTRIGRRRPPRPGSAIR